MIRRYHTLKLQKRFCDAVFSGEKTFEVRYNDRGFQRGDRVRFIAMDGEITIVDHPINNLIYEITYVLSGWGIKEDYVVFGIKQQNTANEIITE